MFSKSTLYILLFIILLAPAKAIGQDLYDYNDSEYDYTDQGAYGEGEIDYKDKPKYISPQDFANAQATIEKYGLNYTQRQKIKKRRQQENIEEESRNASLKTLKASPYALLRLPTDVETAGIIIKAGYYLVQAQSMDGENKIIIAKGTEALVTLHITDIAKQKKKVLEPFIVIENISKEIIDFTLNTKDSIIKFSLPVSISDKS